MPKLDGTHIAERLERRLAELRRGEKVAARDIRTLLNSEQAAAMDAAWEQQTELRAQKRIRTEEAAAASGQKSKRQVHIEALEAALRAAEDAEMEAWERKARAAAVRQARIYLDVISKERDAGADMGTAKARANNALTRAGLRRLDRQAVRAPSTRDAEVWELELQLRKQIEAEMSTEEREQLELLREDESATERSKKAGR